MQNNEKSRLLGRKIGREISLEEIDTVSGAGCCYATGQQATTYEQEGYGTQPDVIYYQYDYTCYYA